MNVSHGIILASRDRRLLLLAKSLQRGLAVCGTYGLFGPLDAGGRYVEIWKKISSRYMLNMYHEYYIYKCIYQKGPHSSLYNIYYMFIQRQRTWNVMSGVTSSFVPLPRQALFLVFSVQEFQARAWGYKLSARISAPWLGQPNGGHRGNWARQNSMVKMFFFLYFWAINSLLLS